MAIPRMNLYGVGASSRGVAILRPTTSYLSAEEALNLAAYLVIVATTLHETAPSTDDFLATLRAIRNGEPEPPEDTDGQPAQKVLCPGCGAVLKAGSSDLVARYAETFCDLCAPESHGERRSP